MFRMTRFIIAMVPMYMGLGLLMVATWISPDMGETIGKSIVQAVIVVANEEKKREANPDMQTGR